MLAAHLPLTPSSAITSIQSRRFQYVAHSLQRCNSAKPCVSSILRTLHCRWGGGTPFYLRPPTMSTFPFWCAHRMAPFLKNALKLGQDLRGRAFPWHKTDPELASRNLQGPKPSNLNLQSRRAGNLSAMHRSNSSKRPDSSKLQASTKL